MMLIKAQRLKNERRKSTLNLIKQPRNLKSAQGPAKAWGQPLSRSSAASSTARKLSAVHTSQASASTAARSTMKIDVRRLKY